MTNMTDANTTAVNMTDASYVIHSKPVSDIVKRILDTPLIKELYDNGGFIAGGFARMCAIGKMQTCEEVADYLSPMTCHAMTCHAKISRLEIFNQINRPGDIDIFFSPNIYHTSDNDINELLKRHARADYHLMPHISMTGLCLNVNVNHDIESLLGSSCQYAQIQCVTHASLRGTPKKVLQTFDIVNCRAAIMGDGSMLVDSRLVDLEASKTLLVARNNSPMLMKRVLKYVYQRGIANIHPESREPIRSWLAQHISETPFESTAAVSIMHKHMKTIKERVSIADLKALAENNTLTAQDLVMCLGNYIETRQIIENYRLISKYQVDVALEAIQKK